MISPAKSFAFISLSIDPSHAQGPIESNGIVRDLQQKSAIVVLFDAHSRGTIDVGTYDGLILLDINAIGIKDKVERTRATIAGFYQEQKPILAVGWAVAALAMSLPSLPLALASGNSLHDMKSIAGSKVQALFESCPANDFVTDREHRVISTPANLFRDASHDQIRQGLALATKELFEMA